ncbi:hypothetical protein [Nonomuraea dietziae]|uniref:hypothetical protein n=1 Tax=Nonomuraea dietziae TaxID=65515 RepID=UPI0031D2C6C7
MLSANPASRWYSLWASTKARRSWSRLARSSRSRLSLGLCIRRPRSAAISAVATSRASSRIMVGSWLTPSAVGPMFCPSTTSGLTRASLRSTATATIRPTQTSATAISSHRPLAGLPFSCHVR